MCANAGHRDDMRITDDINKTHGVHNKNGKCSKKSLDIFLPFGYCYQFRVFPGIALSRYLVDKSMIFHRHEGLQSLVLRLVHHLLPKICKVEHVEMTWGVYGCAWRGVCM